MGLQGRKGTRTGGLVVEVWQSPPPQVDCTMAAGLNQRLAHVYEGSQGLKIWREVMLHLLAKVRVPKVSKDLRSIALQNALARVWSRLMFTRLEVFGDHRGDCPLGFKKGHSVAEVSLVFRLLRDRCLEWGLGFCALQLNFAIVYGSVVHAALRDSMLARGVPASEVMWYIRETRASCLHPSEGHRCAPEVTPQRGLGQGCSCSPMIFRWVVQDAVLPLVQTWRRRRW